MDLVRYSLEEFADELASDSPAPGGGSVSALAGSLGAALTAMVCALTLGKKKYEDAHETAARTQEEALALKAQLLEAVDKDTEAFHAVSSAYKLPKGTEKEKRSRSEAIQEGLAACIESPLRIMDLSLRGLRLAEGMLQGFNTSAASDLGVSVLMLKAGLQGAWLNVRINLGSLKDKEKAAAYEQKAQTILDEALSLANRTILAVGDLLEEK